MSTPPTSGRGDMPFLPDKLRVVEAARAALATELAAIERTGAAARDEATSEETRAEGKYDTRATEASYLARGQAERIAALRRLVAWFEVFPFEKPAEHVQVGALVALEGRWTGSVLVTPSGGGQVEVQGVPVRLVSPEGPLGAAMDGLEAGDIFEVEGPAGPLAYEVLAVR